MKTFTKNKHYMFLVSIPYNAKSLSMWDEMDSSSDWMIQAKTYGSFYLLYCKYGLCDEWAMYVKILLCNLPYVTVKT